MSKKLTIDEIIERGNQIHNNKYDYSLVDYKNSKTKVKIICPEHGIFEQIINAHLSGFGCNKCGYVVSTNKSKLTTKKFIERANKIHNNKYIYSLLDYNNVNTKVKIICSEHGVFEQSPASHLSGSGCNKCSYEKNGRKCKLTIKEFIIKAKTKHGDKYDYSYFNNNQIKRYHRFNFRKDNLKKDGFDINKSEHKIMLERNFYRIYDSGKLKYQYNI